MPDNLLYAFSILLELDPWGGLKTFMGKVLEGLYSLTAMLHIPNYALAILIFALIIKLLLYPLTIKQMRSMRDMQKVQPMIDEINIKYRDNKEKKNEEMVKIYQRYNVNPAAGCFPLLIQMPILFAVFQMLRDFAPAVPADYTFFWITDLSGVDPTGIILPIIVGLTSFAQQWVNTTNKADMTQKAMLVVMPAMMAVFCRTMPAGLGIYWAGISVLGAIQQIFINKKGAKEDAAKEAQHEEEKEARKTKKAEAIARAKEAKTTKPGKGGQQAKKPITEAGKQQAIANNKNTVNKKK